MSARSRAAAVAACAVAVPLVYVLVHALRAPMLWLDPESMRWSFGERPTSLAMDFYGRSLMSIVAGALAYASAGVISRDPRPWMLRTAAVLMVAALVGAVGFEAMRLLPRAAPVPIIAVARR